MNIGRDKILNAKRDQDHCQDNHQNHQSMIQKIFNDLQILHLYITQCQNEQNFLQGQESTRAFLLKRNELE